MMRAMLAMRIMIAGAAAGLHRQQSHGGRLYDFIGTQNKKIGLGALASRCGIPDALKSKYGDPTSYMIFGRLKIQ